MSVYEYSSLGSRTRTAANQLSLRLRPAVCMCATLLMLSMTSGCAGGADEPEEAGPIIRVGSKKFTESAILGEMLYLIAKDRPHALRVRAHLDAREFTAVIERDYGDGIALA